MEPHPLVVVDLVEWLVDNPETGWILVLIYLVIEIRGPWGRVHGLMKLIRANTVVVRAIARTNDQIDTEAADQLLAEDEHEPQDFIDMGPKRTGEDDDDGDDERVGPIPDGGENSTGTDGELGSSGDD